MHAGALCSAEAGASYLVLECLGAPFPQQKQEDLAVGILICSDSSVLAKRFWFFIWAWLFVGLSFLPQELRAHHEPEAGLPTWSVRFDLSAGSV